MTVHAHALAQVCPTISCILPVYDKQVMEAGVDRKLCLIWNYIKLV